MLDFISTIAANRDSGRLNVVTGTTAGALLFNDGKLVDARLGNLTGFQAINALAAMPDVRYSFDPSVVPHEFSSITQSERVVLKQFFGIETVEPRADNEATVVVTGNTAHAELPAAPTYALTPRFSYARAFVMAAAVIVIAAAVAVLIFMSRERTTTPTQQATAVEPVSAPARVSPAAVSTAPAADSTAPAPVSTAARAAHDLTGKWTVVNTVDTTSYQQFKNMKIGFDVSINQTGKTFTGKGKKISENGRSLPANSRTPIQLQGTIEGNRVEATFFEEGTGRKSNGRFVWRIDNSGLTGIFATTAARSSGKSAARREL